MTRWAKLKRRYRRARCTPDRVPALHALRAYVRDRLRKEVIQLGKKSKPRPGGK